jgi:FkbM family methyltransferase
VQDVGEGEFVDVSQHGEAGILAGLVGEDWPRFLVDVGAHDGRSLSNSFPFLQLGWSGVVVEPLPAAFERLLSLYGGRSGVRCVHAACAAEDGEMALVVGDDAPLAMTSSLRAAPGRRSVDVRVRTLTSLLSECAAPADFSLLLVDAEGIDREVLSGLDFERWRPRVVVTEDRDPELLSARGYVLYTVVRATNAIWLRADLMPGDPPARSGVPLLSPAEARRTVPREILERRCLELERSRDEIWQRLRVLETSRSWALTRPLRALARRIRPRG